MKYAIAIFFLSNSMISMAQDQVELCRSDNARVYSRAFKKEESDSGDHYQITITVQNDSFDDLFYSRKVRVEELISDNPNDPMLPPFVTIQVLNAADGASSGTFNIHGAVTLHMSANSTQIFKVSMKRNEHTYKVQIRKGEPPLLKCFFTEELIPWDSVKLMPLIRKN